MFDSVKGLIWDCCFVMIVFTILFFLFKRPIFALAGKNLLKNSRRTIILFCVMVSGLTGMIAFFGYAEHSLYNLREGTIRTGIGHIQLYKKGYNATGNVDKEQYTISNYTEISEILQKDKFLADKIHSIGAELGIRGIIANENTSSLFWGKGVQVEKDKLLSSEDQLVKGKPLEQAEPGTRKEQVNLGINESEDMFDYFEVGDDKKAKPGWEKIWRKRDPATVLDVPSIDDVLIGEGLSTALNAEPGKVLTVMVATKSGSLNAVDVTVRGIISGFSKEYNDSILKMSMEYAWVLMNRQDVSQISILLKNTDMTSECMQRIQTIIKEKNLDLEMTSWMDVALYYMNVHMLFLMIFLTIGTIITLVVFFSITNVMTMNVMERYREIGTLRSLGETKFGVIQIFMIEGILIGIVGGIISILCGIGLAEFIEAGGGFPHPPPPGSTEGFQAFLYVTNRPVIWGIAFMVAFMSAFLSSILPARKAANMEIVDALRFT